MSGLMQTIRCWTTGQCDEPEDPVQMIQTTHDLLREVDKVVLPLRRRIAADERERPELGAALREAERQVLPSVGDILVDSKRPQTKGHQ